MLGGRPDSKAIVARPKGRRCDNALVLRPPTRLARRHPRHPEGAEICRRPAFPGRGRLRDASVPRAGGLGHTPPRPRGRLPGRRGRGRGAAPGAGRRFVPDSCGVRFSGPSLGARRPLRGAWAGRFRVLGWVAARHPSASGDDRCSAGRGRGRDCAGHAQPLAARRRAGHVHRPRPSAVLPAADRGGLGGGWRSHGPGCPVAGRRGDGHRRRSDADLCWDSAAGFAVLRHVSQPLQVAPAPRQPGRRRRVRAAGHRT